jgi:hypothetical protein
MSYPYSFENFLHYSDKLEMSNSPTIEHFMTNYVSFDWDKNAAYKQLAEDLKKTMICIKSVDKFGNTINEWYPR